MIRKAIKLCKCGCGGVVKDSRRHKYLQGHYWKGKKKPEWIREKISEGCIGRVCSEETKEKKRAIAATKVVFMSKKERRKISLRHKRLWSDPVWRKKMVKAMRKSWRDNYAERIAKSRFGKCGKDSVAWRGGITSDPYCEVWNDQEYKGYIVKRDHYTCQNRLSCSGESKILAVHHIDYDKGNCSPTNLITLCGSCNSRANHNREYWTNFYKSVMVKRKGGVSHG